MSNIQAWSPVRPWPLLLAGLVLTFGLGAGLAAGWLALVAGTLALRGLVRVTWEGSGYETAQDRRSWAVLWLAGWRVSLPLPLLRRR